MHERDALARAQELRKLVDQANAPIFGINLYGAINEWNDKTANLTGYSRAEVFGKPLMNFVMPKLQHSVQDVLQKALRGEETSNYELEFQTKSNDTLFFMVNVSARRDNMNRIVGVVGVAQDVTETQKMEIAIQATANELRQLVETANAPIFGIDVNGNVNEWNNKTAEITGYSKEEAFDKPLVSTFIVPSLQLSVHEVLDNALKGTETSNYELEFRTKSHEIRYLLVNATTRRDVNGNVAGVVGVAQDVTETGKVMIVVPRSILHQFIAMCSIDSYFFKSHLHAVVASRDRAVTAVANELRQLVDNANAPIFGIDVHGDVNEWNAKTAEITGFSKEEALGKPLVATFIVPKLRQSVQEVLDNALKGNETSNYELEFETKSGETRYLLVNATTRRDDESHIVGVVGVAQDVTETAKHDREVSEKLIFMALI